jgi:hypothetical protein
MNIKNFMAAAVVALTAACTSETPAVLAPTPEATEAPVLEGGPCGDGRVLGENEVCP